MKALRAPAAILAEAGRFPIRRKGTTDMKTVITLGASVLALCVVSIGPAAAEWRGDDGYRDGGSRGHCRTVREWRHGEMRITRVCRPRVYGRYQERRYVRPDWERGRRYDDDDDFGRRGGGGGNGNNNGNGNFGDNNGNNNGNFND
jgi:hypothetical protein